VHDLQCIKLYCPSVRSPDKIEAAYRFIRNEKVSPDEITNTGLKHTNEII
jgi:hypothetical protein